MRLRRSVFSQTWVCKVHYVAKHEIDDIPYVVAEHGFDGSHLVAEHVCDDIHHVGEHELRSIL